MITVAALAEYFEDELNALISSDEKFEFKIWAEAGHYKSQRRQGNEIYYYINGLLAVSTSAYTPNALVMGVNGLSLTFLVPTLPPKTDVSQTDSELVPEQKGQLYMIQNIANILLGYFDKTKSLSMTDAKGNEFNIAMYSGVSISGVLDIYPKVGEAMPMSVSITMNFADGGVNGMDIKVYLDGELVPYMSLNPSRSSQLVTDVQSNTSEQGHVATSSAFGVQFTTVSATSNQSTLAVYNYIADGKEAKVAHFVEVEWGSQRDDIYFTLFTTANGTVTGAEFAGLNATLGEAYQNEEFFDFPSEFGVGTFSASDSTAESLTFSISASFTKTYDTEDDIPDTYPLYYVIAGKAYKLTATRSSTSSNIATFTATGSVSVALGDENYAYDEDTDAYVIYLIASKSVSVTGVSSGFTYSEVN